MIPDYGAETKGMAINLSKFPMDNYTNPKTSGQIQDELRHPPDIDKSINHSSTLSSIK